MDFTNTAFVSINSSAYATFDSNIDIVNIAAVNLFCFFIITFLSINYCVSAVTFIFVVQFDKASNLIKLIVPDKNS